MYAFERYNERIQNDKKGEMNMSKKENKQNVIYDDSLVKEIASKYKHLSEQDIREGLEIMNAFCIADEDGRKALKVYSGCLTDMALFRQNKQIA